MKLKNQLSIPYFSNKLVFLNHTYNKNWFSVKKAVAARPPIFHINVLRVWSHQCFIARKTIIVKTMFRFWTQILIRRVFSLSLSLIQAHNYLLLGKFNYFKVDSLRSSSHDQFQHTKIKINVNKEVIFVKIMLFHFKIFLIYTYQRM